MDTGGFEGTAICCAYAPATGTDVQPPDVRDRLRKVLPTYMLPARWLVLDGLPKNVNGKIDRRSIREHFEQEVQAEPAAVSERAHAPESVGVTPKVSTGHFRRPAGGAGARDDGTASGA